MGRFTEHIGVAVAAVLVGAVATGVAFLLTTQEKISRPQMVDYVDREVAPIERSLEIVESLQREQLQEQAALSAKMDVLVDVLKGD